MALSVYNPTGYDPSRVDLSAIGRLQARLDRIAPGGQVDATDLMTSYMQIITDDNRRGVLAGTDRWGRPMAPVKYRPVGRAKRPTGAQRNTANARARRGAFAGFGPAAAGLNNNLTRAEYEKLGGPPLAPRGAFSRAITNLVTGYQRIGPATWQAFGYWSEVVSVRGVPFLHAHFTGAATGRGHSVRLPARDLAGVRPEGLQLAAKAAKNWLFGLIRRQAA